MFWTVVRNSEEHIERCFKEDDLDSNIAGSEIRMQHSAKKKSSPQGKSGKKPYEKANFAIIRQTAQLYISAILVKGVCGNGKEELQEEKLDEVPQTPEERSVGKSDLLRQGVVSMNR